MVSLFSDLVFPFVLFVSALFLLVYRFKKERSRLILFVFFVVVCFARMFIFRGGLL